MIDMRKILKKTATLMMTAVIGVSMSCPKNEEKKRQMRTAFPYPARNGGNA